MLSTVKVLNFRTPKMFAVINLKFKQRFFHREIYPKCADRMANSADPDKTAPLSADQLYGYHTADLRLCFPICKKEVFS